MCYVYLLRRRELLVDNHGLAPQRRHGRLDLGHLARADAGAGVEVVHLVCVCVYKCVCL